MSSALELTVRECGAGLCAMRPTERKRYAENLKGFLSSDAVPSLLTENTIQKKGYGWDDLFDDIHEFIIKETEQYENNKHFYNVIAPLCTSLLHACVSGSNKGNAYIKCEKLIDACLLFLKDIRLSKAIGDAYLSLLSKHVLNCDHYLGYITPASWADLLNVCQSMCLASYCKLDDFTKMKLVWLIVKSATNCCQFTIPLRDCLPKMKNCFYGIEGTKKLQDIAIEIMIRLLENLSCESRLTMCEFMESLMSPILKFYDQNLDQKKKSSFFKLLRLIVTLHHPLGKTQKEDGSLAHDWAVWKKQLLSILEIICLEVAHLQKPRKLSENLKYQEEFFSLAASVHYQVFVSQEPVVDESETGSASKRLRLSMNRNKTFGDIIEELRQNHLPWLSIMNIYIKKYSCTISVPDYLQLAKVLDDLLTNSKTLNWVALEQATCSVIRNLLCKDNTFVEGNEILISLWNSCVRTCTITNSSQTSHTIMQLILTADILKHQNVQPLMKLYYDKAMPVTDHSVMTLNYVFHKFYSHCSSFEKKLQYFHWLVNGNITNVSLKHLRQMLLRVIASDNFAVINKTTDVETDKLEEVIFDSLEKSILFSLFELENDKMEPEEADRRPVIEQVELSNEMNDEALKHFQSILKENTDKLTKNDIDLLEFIKLTGIVLVYFDCAIKYKVISRNQIKKEQVFCLLKNAMRLAYVSLTSTLKCGEVEIPVKVNLLQYAQDLFNAEYDPVISAVLRTTVNDTLFHTINNILHLEANTDPENFYTEDDSQIDPKALRHNCICFLAAYCRKRQNYRGEILELVLDPKLYNFNTSWDFACATQCIELLISPEVEDSPLEAIFTLMQRMCKDLFRNSNASYKILNILIKILDRIWSHDSNMKQNCFIMVKGYILRCEKSYYSPRVAALIYKCAGKLIELSQQSPDIDNSFSEILMQKAKGDIHRIRIYCCYTLKNLITRLPDAELLLYVSSLMDIFTIEVSERKETVEKDENLNRMLTILHSAFALVQAKNSFLYSIVNEIIEIQKKKTLDEIQTKKVLNKITKLVTKASIEKHLNDNILSVLNFWYLKGNHVNRLPWYLFGFETMDEFLETHQKLLVPADLLWGTEGVISESEILKQIQDKTGKSAESVIEACLGNILMLCLPYLVTKQYSLNYMPPGKFEWAENALKIFESSRQMLKGNKWSSAFAGTLTEFLTLLATHLKDHTAAATYFNATIPLPNKSYQYPKIVFEGTLKYISELIKQDYMQYLCENRACGVPGALFKLWQDVLQENIFEYKLLNLHTYMTLLEMIPLGCTSDAFVCSYACSSLKHAIKISKSSKEIEAYAKVLKSILDRLLPEKVELLRNSISQLLSILMLKKEDGFQDECSSLLNFLVTNMRDYPKEDEDVIDFVTSLTQGGFDNATCPTMFEFIEKLHTYRKSLSCPSHESLMKLRQFLTSNKRLVNNLCDEINSKGFSDDCGESVIHQVIHALCNITISTSDDKTITEACNCLAEIGNYDLKTLVTVPPENTQRVTNVHPKQYFAIVIKSSLAEVLFDGNPDVTNAVAKALIRLLQFREGKTALDLEDVDKLVLLPFASSNPAHCAAFTINDAKFEALLVSSLWTPNCDAKHGQWLMKITVALLDILLSTDNYLTTLRAACVAKPDLCRKIMPSFMGLLLTCSTPQNVKLLADQITRFFNHIWEMNFEHRLQNSEDSNSPTSSSSLEQDLKMIVQYMLDIVNFTRLQRHHYKPRSERTMESLNYLRLDYDKVAWAALAADQNLVGIYYGELWAMANNDGVPPSSPETLSQLIGGENMQHIFRRCFVSIGEMDAIDGCGTAHLTSEEEKRKHLINTRQFTDALLLHDIALSSGTQVDPQLQYGVVKSLHKSGMHHLALQYIKSLPENEELDDIKYDCLSYLGDWSDFVNTSDLEEKSKQANCNPQSIIKAFRYSCLKDCINLQATTDFKRKLIVPLNRAKLAVARLSQNLNMENCQSVYKILSKLHQFKDIEDYFSVRCDKLPLTDLLDRWQVENLPPYNDFKHLEALISQRSLILEHGGKIYTDALKDIVDLQLQYAELGVSNNRVQIAQRLLAMVKKMHSSPEIALVESHISWAKGHKDIALSLLRQIVSHPSPDVRLTAMSLRQYGMWMAESKCEKAREIIDKYLKKSLQVLNGNDDKETRLKVYYDIAKFADAEYKQIVTYMNSTIFEKKVKVLEDMKDTATVLKSTQQLSKDERKAMITTDRFGQIDEAEIASTRAEKESFLRLAMRYYLLSLKEGEANNLSIFRVISLWLDNPAIEFEDDSFSQLLHSIPSRKFITVLPQLTPRINNEKTELAENLTRILKRCACEHPHHTLPHLFSLKNSDKDKMILNASENIGGGSGRKKRASVSLEPRVAAAEELISQLAEDDHLADIIAQVDRLCDAIISIANFVPLSKDPSIKHKIPAAERIHRLRPLTAIPIPTVTIPVSAVCDYTYVTSLHCFENYFELVGGINCPKKISCRGSDGISRILLIKGEDDLRQDAVMQQVFDIVNTLLENNPFTKRNKLLIRTYKVVPMSRRSGVLEWCEGTMPIGAYLTGTRNAHARYRPQDISVIQARAMMEALGKQRKSNAEKLATFSRILRELRPVFHYFFTEYFLDPVTWYERRLAYTKSVAASSMVGHILGLGDRHLQNILIDKRTAEVVHIDFGIAFDQGKALPTPETIPFRLTQDIVAAFGSSGVEGIFRKCCERTMQLLRDNQDTLLTILEVLLCDPLYSWSVISKQQNVLTAQTAVNQSSSEGSLAKRALLTVSSKLSGTEGGVAGGVSVSGQVARLIHTAMDPANLSRLYVGWQPYL